MKILDKSKSLAEMRPDIAAEWCYEKNDLTPLEVTYGVAIKVWWKCEKGHLYEATINKRTNGKGTGCPVCAGHKVLRGYNDLETLRPDISREWDKEKNTDLNPFEVSVRSAKKVWWKCPCGHSYQCTIANRTNNRGCPICSGRRVQKGINDLEKLRPDIAIFWDYEKNLNINPSDVTVSSGKTVWWKCPNGHSYQARIISRTGKKKAGCPYCSGKAVIKGENDLKTLRPDLAKEWDSEKNGDLSPDEVKVGSNKKVWWKCPNGHGYQAVINLRARKDGSGCPYCIGRSAIKGENDLATLRPDIARQWNKEKNGMLEPCDVTVGSSVKVWWDCENGHSYLAAIYSRTSRKSSDCPYCSGRLAIDGENDLMTLRPDMARAWNNTKNHGLTPSDVKVNSGRKVWWKCPKCGHEWRQVIYKYARGLACPKCEKIGN